MQEVTGLNSISLSRSAKKIPTGARVYYGSNCEWIDLNKVLSDGVGCANGLKFVIKPKRGSEKPKLAGCKFPVCSGNRRQLLFVDGKTILAFVTQGSKFTNCSSFTEVTSQVNCKVRIVIFFTLTLLSSSNNRWIIWGLSASPLPAALKLKPRMI